MKIKEFFKISFKSLKDFLNCYDTEDINEEYININGIYDYKLFDNDKIKYIKKK
tara:strand:+ start:4789 stop:4950 length:162 start_codon:yes stop_codon:yes gene_type:complete